MRLKLFLSNFLSHDKANELKKNLLQLNYLSLHLLNLLAVKSRDLSQVEQKITVAKAEQIKKLQLFLLKMTTFDLL